MARRRSSSSKGPNPPVTLNHLAVCGFKSIDERREISVRPLTILAGKNSSGKSSMLQPLLLLKQTADAPFDTGPLYLNGPNAKFSSFDELLSKRPSGETAPHTTIELGLSNGSRFAIDFGRTTGHSRGLRIIEWRLTQDQQVLRYTPEMASEAVRRAVPTELHEHFSSLLKGHIDWRISAERFFFQLIAWSRKDEFAFPVYSPSYPFADLSSRVIHVPGLRGNPERTYQVTGTGKTFVGTFERYVASIIASWSRKNATRKETTLREWMQALDLTWKVVARPVSETQVELLVGRLPQAKQGGAHDLVNVADVGFGVSQTLPVLVALVEAEVGQVVYIEQPEIHLHPRAQVALALILAEAAKRGVTVVVETHSALLLLAIQTLVAEGRLLRTEDVALHWFTRDDGQTEIATAEMDRAGSFGNWPEDFGSVSIDLERRYLDAAEPYLPGFEVDS
jgi:predicted ATPase